MNHEWLNTKDMAQRLGVTTGTLHAAAREFRAKLRPEIKVRGYKLKTLKSGNNSFWKVTEDQPEDWESKTSYARRQDSLSARIEELERRVRDLEEMFESR